MKQLHFKPRLGQLILAAIVSTLILSFSYMVYFQLETTKGVYYLSQIKECSDGALKEYFRQRNYFPGDGVWQNVTGSKQLSLSKKDWLHLWKEQQSAEQRSCQQLLSQYTSDDWYFPGFCSLSPRFLTKNELSKCIHRNQMKYIVAIGDSNGSKYSMALVSLIQGILQGTCFLQKVEFGGNLTKIVDSKYFLNLNTNRDDLLSKDLKNITLSVKTFTMDRNRWCIHCFDRLWKCKYNSNLNKNNKHKLYLEFLGLDLLDRNLLHVTTSSENNDTTYTYLEYLMNHYLATRKPDLLVIFPPFIHMKSTIKASHLMPIMMEILHLVQSSLRTTKVYWIPSFRQHEDLVPEKIRGKKYFTKMASEQILDMNHVLFKALKPHLMDPGARTFSFWDMYSVHDNQTKWVCDGAHMYPVWYIKMMGQLLQLYCNS